MALAIRFENSKSVVWKSLHERDERELEKLIDAHAASCRDGADCPLSVLESVLVNQLLRQCENRPEIVREGL